MISLSFNGLWSHKRRLLGSFFAIFLGVSFLAGTLVLTDTLGRSINDTFKQSNADTDVVVRSAVNVTGDKFSATRGPIDASLVSTVQGVAGVADAVPVIQGYGQIVGSDGKAISQMGPRIAGNWIADDALNPYELAEGRVPQADDEVVIDRGAAKAGKLKVGDKTTILTPDPVSVTVVGVATFGSSDADGGGSYAAFTLSAAERYLVPAGKISTIAIRAQPGVSAATLAERVSAVLPANTEAITGSELSDEQMSEVETGFLDIFRTFLSVFAGVALLVATISIYNAFSVISAQRSRELALLRAVGATAGQVTRAVGLESLALGIGASLAGLLGGIGIATLLKGVFAGFGYALPATGLTMKPASIAIALVAGTVVTVVAGLFPALAAARIPPIAALREAAAERTQIGRPRLIAGALAAALGVVGGVVLLLGNGGSLALAGISALILVVGIVLLGPAFVGRASAITGAPGARIGGISGEIARGNAIRNPRRTAGAATALMVGVAVVALIAIFAASLRSSVDANVSSSFAGDLAVEAKTPGGGGLSANLPATLRALPEVQAATGIEADKLLVDDSSETVTIAEPSQLGQLLQVRNESGSLGDLAAGQLAVSADVAKKHDWQIGSAVTVAFADGATAKLTVGAIYATNRVLGDYVLGFADGTPHTQQARLGTLFVGLKPGVSLTDGKQAVEQAVAPFGAPTVDDRAGFIASRTSTIGILLNFVYVLLALAIVIALMGIANTMSLSITERRHEIGLLRAIGQTRKQARAMVRWESVNISLLGTVGGIALGLFLGWVTVHAASSSRDIASVSIPVVTLAIVAAIGVLAGVLASLLPARTAARLPITTAIATE